MKKLYAITVLLSFQLIGCASSPLSVQEQSIRILRKSDPDRSCKEIQKIHSPAFGAWTEDGREDNLKRETLKVSGNVVAIDRIDDNGTIFGTAYKCPM